jgi:hypothetical protein
MQAWQAHHLTAQHVQFRQGTGKTYRLRQPMFGQATAAVSAHIRVQNKGTRGACGGDPRIPVGDQRQIVVIIGEVSNQSSPS